MRIDNRTARRLWLAATGLSPTPTGALDVAQIIRDLGFLQIDTIRNVTRAHNHIIWTRNQNFREGKLWPLLGRDRSIFEHFTHDASLIPMEFLPYWQRQFCRLGAKVSNSDWYRTGLAKEAVRDIRNRIADEGALSTHAFDTKIEGPREMWARPPHKKALDQMWYAGDLATCFRENFVKHYNLPERVFPSDLRAAEHTDTTMVDWLNRAALDRLWVAAPGEIQRFWEAMSAVECRAWLDAQNWLVPVEVETAERTWVAALALPDIADRVADVTDPTARLRIINPFDPAIRDRVRLKRLFGFDYTNEMFVPAAKRRWGYYVYPLLEGARFVGRIEVKADRAKDVMWVTGFWPEPRVKWTRARFDKLAAELGRFARLAGIRTIEGIPSDKDG
ncbi:MAG: crosslink repair DNA glycosylase YcaQ family protein [Pseudomonadota bacterium]